MTPDARASALPFSDEPRWVEANGIAADPAGVARRVDDGVALISDSAKLVVIAGDATVETVVQLAQELAGHVVLVAIERADCAEALRERAGRRVQRAILHTLPDPDALPVSEGAVRLPDDASLAHVPEALADEVRSARARGAVWTAYVDEDPVAFAYAPWRSERWFDVSVDVLPGARQLGLGALVASAMIRDELAQGRQPVWGADEENVASLRLAQRLGFVERDAVWLASSRLDHSTDL